MHEKTINNVETVSLFMFIYDDLHNLKQKSDHFTYFNSWNWNLKFWEFSRKNIEISEFEKFQI